MIKKDELANPQSCLNKAADDEPIFVLRAKDPAAVNTILHWIKVRYDLALNGPKDAKIQEALALAKQMDEWLHNT